MIFRGQSPQDSGLQPPASEPPASANPPSETPAFPLEFQLSTFPISDFPPPSVLLIPTDPFATRRTNAFFEKTIPGHDIKVLRTDPPDLKTDTWWTQEKGLIAFQNEVIKWLFYKIND